MTESTVCDKWGQKVNHNHTCCSENSREVCTWYWDFQHAQKWNLSAIKPYDVYLTMTNLYKQMFQNGDVSWHEQVRVYELW